MELSELPSHHEQRLLSDRSDINRETEEEAKLSDSQTLPNLASQASSNLSYSMLKKRWTVQNAHPLLKFERIQTIDREPFNRSFLGRMINQCYKLERNRRMKLIMCTENIVTKLNGLKAEEQKELEISAEKQNTTMHEKCLFTFKSILLLAPDTTFLNVFDTVIMIFVVYSIVTSGYYIVFRPPDADWYRIINELFFGVFTLDILVNCCRQYPDINGMLVRSHYLIIERYYKSGQLLTDIVALIPFELMSKVDNQIAMLIKLIRFYRFRNIFGGNHLTVSRLLFSKVFFAQEGANRISTKRLIKKVYQMIRIALITVLLIYFIGVIFYFCSEQTVLDGTTPLAESFLADLYDTDEQIGS